MNNHKTIDEYHSNEVPNSFREITQDEFCHSFFQYVLKGAENKQVFRKENGDLLPKALLSIKFWELNYNGWEGMGLAMATNYNKGKYELKFFKYGSEERWIENQRKFAAQFAGDNS